MAKYEGAEVQTTFTADTSELDQAEKKVNGNFDSMKTSAKIATIAIATAFADMSAKIVESGIEYNAELETYLTRLETLTGSSEKAKDVLEQIKKDAAKTPFDVASLTQAESLLLSTGLSAEESRADILALGDAVSATGGGNAELQRMAVNLQQIKNVGKASALDIKQFAYAGIDIYGLLADSMGITKEEASKMTVTYDDLSQALQKASQKGGKYYKAMDKQSKTYNGAMSNLKESVKVFNAELTEGLFEALKDLVPLITDMFKWLTKNKDVILAIVKPLAVFSGIALGLIAISKVVAGFKLLWVVLTANPIGLIVGAIVGLIEIFKLLWNNCEWFRDLWKGLWEGITGVFRGAVDFIMDFPNKMKQMVTNAINFIKELPGAVSRVIGDVVKFFGELPGKTWKVMTDVVKNIGKWASDMVTKVATEFPKVVSKIVGFFLEIPGKMFQIGVDIVKGIWDGIKSMEGWLKEKVGDFGAGIGGSLKKFLKIGSPSKYMADEIGQWIPKGIAVGIEANEDSVSKSMNDLGKTLNKDMRLDMNPSILASMNPSNIQPIVNVFNDMSIDPLGQVVSNVKTFSGGAKNDYNYGVGV